MKALFKTNFGHNAREDSDMIASSGPGHEAAAAPSAEQLESHLSDVKALFKTNFGNNAREGSADDSIKLPSSNDYIEWNFARGAVPSAEQLENRLAEVKTIFKAKFGINAREEPSL